MADAAPTKRSVNEYSILTVAFIASGAIEDARRASFLAPNMSAEGTKKANHADITSRARNRRATRRDSTRPHPAPPGLTRPNLAVCREPKRILVFAHFPRFLLIC